MGRMLGSFDNPEELDRPDLNKCPDCNCFFAGDNCPLCGKEIVTKRAKGKTIFYSCSGYPDCQFSSWDKPTKEICPSCGKNLFLKKGKEIAVCCNKDCKRHDKGASEQ